MQNIAITISYDGNNFHGFQSQTGVRSIQNELIKALETVMRCKLVSFSPSGRTDRYVSAQQQVCTFSIDENVTFDRFKVAYAVTSILKFEVQIAAICVMPETFHARHSKHIKQYSYKIYNHPCAPPTEKKWHISKTIDIAAMKKAAALFEGCHDFQAFRHANCAAKTTVRILSICEVLVDGNDLTVRVVGNGFMMHMIRIITGTLVEVGTGKRDWQSVTTLLESTKCNEKRFTAPAQALTLDWIRYDDTRYDELLKLADLKLTTK